MSYTENKQIRQYLNNTYGNPIPSGSYCVPLEKEGRKIFISMKVSADGSMTGFREFWDKDMTMSCVGNPPPTRIIDISDFQAIKAVSILAGYPITESEILRHEHTHKLEVHWFTLEGSHYHVEICEYQSSIEFYYWRGNYAHIQTVSNVGPFVRYLNTLNVMF